MTGGQKPLSPQPAPRGRGVGSRSLPSTGARRANVPLVLFDRVLADLSLSVELADGIRRVVGAVAAILSEQEACDGSCRG